MNLPGPPPPTLLTRLPLLDGILEEHAAQLGADFAGYRNHAYRVANLCCALAPSDPDALEAISIAAAFHDLGIWTDGTFDYLAPSQRRAREWLASSAQASLGERVERMICQHHKLTPYRGIDAPWVDGFRRADLADVSRGWIAPAIPSSFLAEVFRRFPNAGFHRSLLRFTCKRFVRHPLTPLPMLRW